MPSPRGQAAPPTVTIGNLKIHDATFEATVDAIVDGAARRSGGCVCTPNVDYVVRARRDQEFRAAVAAATLRVPDGMWIVYASRIAGRPLSGTVTGRLLLPAVVAAGAGKGIRVALFGAGPGVAAAAGSALKARVPEAQIVATVSPPIPFLIGSEADREAVAELRAAEPDVIFVALGAPKQEIWMQAHLSELGGAWLVGVGAALDIVAGRYREAPGWMTRVGLEWAFRLAQEPRRLARRYLMDDPWILWWAVRARLRQEP